MPLELGVVEELFVAARNRAHEVSFAMCHLVLSIRSMVQEDLSAIIKRTLEMILVSTMATRILHSRLLKGILYEFL